MRNANNKESNILQIVSHLNPTLHKAKKPGLWITERDCSGEKVVAEVHQLILDYGVETARALSTSKLERQCLDTAMAVMQDDRFDLNLLHSGFALTALPHRNTKETIWQRTGGQNGEIKLHVESGYGPDKQPIGLPYGSVARLILIHLSTEAVANNSRIVELGSSMRAFLRRMGVAPGGRSFAAVREQAMKISLCRLTFFNKRERDTVINNGSFVKNAVICDDVDDRQMAFLRDTVELDDTFFKSLTDHPLPLRESAIKQLCGRSTALDLYIFLSYRLHVLERPTAVSWASLYHQFGAGTASQRIFKQNFKDPLALALAAYPEARVDMTENGLTLHPSESPVPKTHPWSHRLKIA
jgi:Plasmid encoded RepA protein